jgi:hypothetical protein
MQSCYCRRPSHARRTYSYRYRYRYLSRPRTQGSRILPACRRTAQPSIYTRALVLLLRVK